MLRFALPAPLTLGAVARQGATGEHLTDVVSIGIGGSYLGPEFVYEALRFGACAAGFRRARGRDARSALL